MKIIGNINHQDLTKAWWQFIPSIPNIEHTQSVTTMCHRDEY